MNRRRVALYHRVSTADQDPTTARHELRKYVRSVRGRIVLEVEETVSSRAVRPGLERVMAAARSGACDVVACWKLDRFARSTLDLLMRLRELEEAGVVFVATSQGLTFSGGADPMGRLLLAMLGAVAEFERELIAERTRIGLERARASGAAIGRPPVPRPPTRSVLAARSEGLTWKQTAERLGCTVWAARSVAASEKGGGKRRSKTGSKRPRNGRK